MILIPHLMWKEKSWRLIHSGESVTSAVVGDEVEIILPRTCFYVESGGQVSDTGIIQSTGDSKLGD